MILCILNQCLLILFSLGLLGEQLHGRFPTSAVRRFVLSFYFTLFRFRWKPPAFSAVATFSKHCLRALAGGCLSEQSELPPSHALAFPVLIIMFNIPILLIFLPFSRTQVSRSPATVVRAAPTVCCRSWRRRRSSSICRTCKARRTRSSAVPRAELYFREEIFKFRILNPSMIKRELLFLFSSKYYCAVTCCSFGPLFDQLN